MPDRTVATIRAEVHIVKEGLLKIGYELANRETVKSLKARQRKLIADEKMLMTELAHAALDEAVDGRASA